MASDPQASKGLSQAEAARRLLETGPNEPPAAAREPAWRRAARQLRSPLSYVLLAAIAFDLLFWAFRDRSGIPWGALVIALTLLLNVAIGLLHERRSDAALARLKALAAPRSWVLRDGRLKEAPSRELVPGDVVRLEAGDRVPADGALLVDAPLPFDESLLTGESFPVEHDDGAQVRAGTLLLRGRAHLLVQRTGPRSALGEIAALLAGIEMGKTPLEKRLDRLGHQIVRVVLVVALAVSLLGLAIEGVERAPDVLLFAAALAVAAVPEELPATLALTLAMGVERMAKRNALLRRLPAVESLGSVTVICTDKTGTLTHNRLRVHALLATDEAAALRAMVLANDAHAHEGDPLDVALLAFAAERGVEAEALRRAQPRLSGRPFDSAWKYQRATTAGGSFVKGAPEAVLARCRLAPEDKAAWEARVQAAAREGRRVLALARGEGEAEDALEFLGLVELEDPPRDEARASVEAAQRAGIRVALLTGDHPATAASVAARVGIPTGRVVTGADLDAAPPEAFARLAKEAHVFARILPRHKLRLVEALQEQGEVVAMVGDGVNDAPALKRADVGIAMGQRGSDVAREAAALVLLDDNFATIVDAIEEGRGIHAKTQSILRFMFSTSLGFVLLVLLGSVAAFALGLRTTAGALLLPLTALQILWINFLADGPPAFALGLDRAGGLLDEPPPRPDAALLDRASVRFVVAGAALKALVGLGLLVAGLSVFLYEYLAQLAFAAQSRSPAHAYAPNPWLRVALLACVAAEVALFALPWGREAFGGAVLGARELAAVLGATLVTALGAWALRRAGARRHARAERNQPASLPAAKRSRQA